MREGIKLLQRERDSMQRRLHDPAILAKGEYYTASMQHKLKEIDKAIAALVDLDAWDSVLRIIDQQLKA